VPTSNIPDLPEGLPPWLAAFVLKALHETDALRENGAEQAASARLALLKKLVTAAAAFLDAEIDTHQAALESGRCEETIRRAVRDGTIPDSRANRKDHIRVRRGDLQKLAAHQPGPYDPGADAQDIARLRRKV
jgi:hypothetical protein